ncbi:uncharacterized protein Dwil_GK18948 [Drosophila willistoni]|uniref:Uncharacterized protein n=1 Tax=Drosophila willistoni TaxID=7260 RepID=B4NJV1_DROWI|nr:uncharacterized protein Dwil_GK18948 [Drosophila willistoni]
MGFLSTAQEASSAELSSIGISKNMCENSNNRQIGKDKHQINETNSNGFIVTGNKPIKSAAPTLPMLSPHSPIHPNFHPTNQNNKLSGRYINNKVPPPPQPPHKDVKEVYQKNAAAVCSCDKVNASNGSDSKKTNSTNKSISKTHHPSKHDTELYSIPSNRTRNNLYEVANGSEDTTTSNIHQKNHFQQAIIVSDEHENNTSVNLGMPISGQCSRDLDNHINRQQTFTISKSEQTSPNNLDVNKTNFSYDKTNRSTGCLAYPTDPWIKKKETRLGSIAKLEKNISLPCSIDPWVKRQSSEGPLETSQAQRKSRFQQIKSISSRKIELYSVSYDKSYFLEPQHKQAGGELSTMLSAPSSPQYLNAPDNIFMATNLISKQDSQVKSASFSPGRRKEFQNPFTEPKHEAPPGINPIKSNVYHDNPTSNRLLKKETSNRNLLTVFHPSLSQARHSFSSLSTQSTDELQLNIRRLSDQMRQEPLEKIAPLSASHCNVNKNSKHNCEDDQGDNSNKAALGQSFTEDFLTIKQIAKDSASNSKTPFTINLKPDPLLETTC